MKDITDQLYAALADAQAEQATNPTREGATGITYLETAIMWLERVG